MKMASKTRKKASKYGAGYFGSITGAMGFGISIALLIFKI